MAMAQIADKKPKVGSILIGEFSIFLFQFNILPTFGFLSAIWAIVISIVVLVLGSYITQEKT